jgi:hypothetical protein
MTNIWNVRPEPLLLWQVDALKVTLDAARSLRSLTDLLARHPEALP